jgi:hypothetical protein
MYRPIVSVCLPGTDLNGHAKAEKHRPSEDTLGILNLSFSG